MGGKHLKKLRAEKSKVKLNKKKMLAKAQNITNTSFKVKKIVTVEQLKKVDESEPVSSWNVPLKDLLVRLNHYNYMTRLNGLNGIRELVTNYPDVLKGPSLRPAIVKVLELLNDNEHKIRTTAINLLDFLFTHMSNDSIIPFHDILVVHMNCAMTHRDVSVQQDSIKFVDVMIQHAPGAMKKNFKNLLQNFIRIIKIYLYGRQLEVSSSKSSSLEKNRSEIFFRFYHILVLVYSIGEDTQTGGSGAVNCSQGRFPLRKVDYKKIPDMKSLFKNSTSDENGLEKTEAEQFQLQVSLIMPLLFHTWLECNPHRQSDGFSCEYALSQTAAELLLVILNILLLLHEKLMALNDADLQMWFISTYGAQFKKCFTTHFPYLPSINSRHPDSPGTGDNTSHTNLSTYKAQNLIICYLFYCFKLNIKNSDQEARVERYVSTALIAKSASCVNILSKVLGVFINTKSKKLNVTISTVVKAYNMTSSPELRRNLFRILMQIALEKRSDYLTNQNFVKWMKSLPELLLKPRVPSYVIDTILKFIVRPEGAEVLKVVETKAADIINHLPSVKIEGMDQFEGQKLIANILFRCGSKALEQTLKKGALQKNSYPHELKSYIIDILSYKLTGQSNLFSI